MRLPRRTIKQVQPIAANERSKHGVRSQNVISELFIVLLLFRQLVGGGKRKVSLVATDSRCLAATCSARF